ncbi:MAG: hypothetical protein K2X87_27330, partial [Gemmataceae bacterium]|nr:hypothetical protein [Gemmataceae bacterium]
LPTLVALAGLLQRQGRAADAAGLWLKALTVHPLDGAVRFRAATAVLAAARRQAAGAMKAADAAAALLDRHRSLLEEQTPAAAHALRSVLFTKRGKADAAAAERAAALAVPGGRVGAAYRVMVDAVLLKLKPADKRAADALFAAELAEPPTPWEVNQLIAAYDAYHVDGVTFRGQKGHDKKVLDQVARCADAAGPPEEFERLLNILLLKREWRHAKKLADAMIVRFPADPYFHLARAEAGYGGGERAYYVENRLRRAKGLAERSADPRHRAVLGRIEKLLQEVAPPLDLFEAFFGR